MRQGLQGTTVYSPKSSTNIAPLVLARERRLEVSRSLTGILPEGLQRGSVIALRGIGSSSLALALAAGPVAAGSWLAVVGGEDLCLAAMEQLGIAMQRVVLIDEPPQASWGAVVGAVTDAFDIIVISAPRIGARDARRLMPRLRERGNVIIDLGGGWPEAADITLTVVAQQWHGLELGHGVLTSREVMVEITGRRGATRPTTVGLMLPNPEGAPEATRLAHAGADADLLESESTGAAQHDATITPFKRTG